MLKLDDDEVDLALTALRLMRRACEDVGDPAQDYLGRQAANLADRMAQYQKDRRNGDV